MVWKMIFLFQGCILRLHINLPGCKNLFLQKNGHPITIRSIRLRFLPQTSRGGGMIMATHIARELGILLFTLQDLVPGPGLGVGGWGLGGKGRAKPTHNQEPAWKSMKWPLKQKKHLKRWPHERYPKCHDHCNTWQIGIRKSKTLIKQP